MKTKAFAHFFMQEGTVIGRDETLNLENDLKVLRSYLNVRFRRMGYGCPGDVDDLVQETMLRSFAGNYRTKPHPIAYLIGISAHVFSDWQRARVREGKFLLTEWQEDASLETEERDSRSLLGPLGDGPSQQRLLEALATVIENFDKDERRFVSHRFGWGGGGTGGIPACNGKRSWFDP